MLLRIDFARNITEDWRKVGFLSDDEYYYLVACIVRGIPFCKATFPELTGRFIKNGSAVLPKSTSRFCLPIYTNGRTTPVFNGNGADVLKETLRRYPVYRSVL